jgi:TPR repeat protein
MAATLTSSLPLSVISAFLSTSTTLESPRPHNNRLQSRHDAPRFGSRNSSTYGLACGRAMQNGGRLAAQQSRRSSGAGFTGQGQTDALAALCLSFSPNPNAGESLAWLRRAADLGLPDAQLLLGADLEVGFKSPPNSHEAMRWYRKAAQADFPFAQYELGCHLFGRQGQPTARLA